MKVDHDGTASVARVTEPHYPPAAHNLCFAHAMTITMPPSPEHRAAAPEHPGGPMPASLRVHPVMPPTGRPCSAYWFCWSGSPGGSAQGCSGKAGQMADLAGHRQPGEGVRDLAGRVCPVFGGRARV